MQERKAEVDHSWGEAIRRGDPAAFRRIYTELVPRLLDLAYGYVGSQADAEELVQDVVFGLWENRDHFDPTGDVVHYLFRAIRNRAINTVTRERTTTKVIEQFAAEQIDLNDADLSAITDADDPAASDPSALATHTSPDAFWKAYEQAVNQLPERCREVYLLSRSANLTYAEISLVLGISIHTVNAHMGRALKLLRTALRQWRP